MSSILFAMHYLALGIGYGFLAVGGVAAFALFAWACVQAIADRVRWTARLHRYSRHIAAAERAEKEHAR
jgi:ABC-type transport system involved in cytochrome c biogenesis permease subunit